MNGLWGSHPFGAAEPPLAVATTAAAAAVATSARPLMPEEFAAEAANSCQQI
jgi:hypothetical protein